MQNIILKIFQSNKTKPTKAVLKSFESIFGQPVNVEWHRENNNYEVLFYIEERENIALFAPDGVLIEKKQNLVLSEASPEVVKQAKYVGELMNLIEITRDGKIFYDVIARDLYLDRYYLLLDHEGNLIEKKKL